MEENVLTKNEASKVRKVFFAYLLIALIAVVFITITSIIDDASYYDNNHEHELSCYKYSYYDDYYNDKSNGSLIEYKMNCIEAKYDNAFSYAIDRYFEFFPFGICLIILLLVPFIGFLHSAVYARRIVASKAPPVIAKEHRMRCKVCGHIFCYTDEDVANNTKNAGLAALSALGGVASILGGGTIFHTHHLKGQADRYNDKVVDYTHCPSCHSKDIVEIE